MIDATALLLPGNMCDERLWATELRALFTRSRDVEFRDDDNIAAMADRALAAAEGPLLPIGFSMGAIVALAIAERAPERLAGLVLLDCNPAADFPARAAVRARQQADVRAGRLLDVVVNELKPNYLAQENRDNQPLLTLLRDMALSLGPDTFVRQSEALRTRPSYAHVAPSLDCPLFVAVGAEDRLCPPEWHKTLAAGAKHATLHIIPGAGHMLPLEQPQALAAALEHWIGNL